MGEADVSEVINALSQRIARDALDIAVKDAANAALTREVSRLQEELAQAQAE